VGWSSSFIFIFGTNQSVVIDNTDIKKSLLRIAKYIKSIKLFNDKLNNSVILGFGHTAWTLISSIYEAGWNRLKTKNQDMTFCQSIAA